jgi:hypothetical protein
MTTEQLEALRLVAEQLWPGKITEAIWGLLMRELGDFYFETAKLALYESRANSDFVSKPRNLRKWCQKHIAERKAQKEAECPTLGPGSDKKRLLAAIEARMEQETTGSGAWVFVSTKTGRPWVVERDGTISDMQETAESNEARWLPLKLYQSATIHAVLLGMKFHPDGEITGYRPGACDKDEHIRRIKCGEIQFLDPRRKAEALAVLWTMTLRRQAAREAKEAQ